MIKSKKDMPIHRVVIDLTGPGGNAFALLGVARSFGRQLKWDSQKITEVTKEMMNGDYDNLVSVFDREFGQFVTLYK